MEITQFTYFQQVGSVDVKPVASEITYGLERIAMYIQEKKMFMILIGMAHTLMVMYSIKMNLNNPLITLNLQILLFYLTFSINTKRSCSRN